MITDIMTTEIVAGSAEFVALTPGALEIPLTAVAPPGIGFRAASSAFQWFESGDNILIDQISINLPYGFGEGESGANPHRLQILWFGGTTGFNIPIPELGDGSWIVLPSTCHALEFAAGGLFIQTPQQVPSQRYRLNVLAVNLGVSMVNLPPVLNAVTVTPRWTMVVRHSRALQVVP